MDIYFSVIMPTFNQCAFIRRAILSLMRQTYGKWELIIVNDGCTDETETYIEDYLQDPRIRCIRNHENHGQGYALNQGLDAARHDYIAYLPSDDFYYEDHLQTLMDKFEETPNLVLAYSGMKYESNDTQHATRMSQTPGVRPGYCLQLVQTAHRKTARRWLTRGEWVTEDLFQMFWAKLLEEGTFGRTERITCNWTSHPHQRHRITGERYGGGLNKYRAYYKVRKPIRIKVSRNKFTDEVRLYESYRQECKPVEDRLRILLVGELAYNAERIHALEQAGHELYGLWTPWPEYSFSTVGPLPFGHAKDIPYDDNWKESVREVKPDVIYGLLNSGAVPFVYDVARQLPEIPYVWHFKEGPSVCLNRGHWDKLIWLYQHAAGRIFLNKTVRDWYRQFLAPDATPEMMMDGDLPPAACFGSEFSKKLSDAEGGIHTVITGRMIGISESAMAVLAKNDIHIHLYTESYFDLNARQTDKFSTRYKDYFHCHRHVSQAEWTRELSKYDAGWLHCINSSNGGNLLKASWDDLNMPARMSTYAAAGIPFIIPANTGHIVASRDMAAELGVAITFDSYEELAGKLREEVSGRALARNMMENSMKFSFDYYVPQFISFIRESIKHRANG